VFSLHDQVYIDTGQPPIAERRSAPTPPRLTGLRYTPARAARAIDSREIMPATPTHLAVGDHVRRLRAQTGMSVRTLARKTGFSPSFMS
jgi:hypothetical protein